LDLLLWSSVCKITEIKVCHFWNLESLLLHTAFENKERRKERKVEVQRKAEIERGRVIKRRDRGRRIERVKE